jgi:hypothetical protein
LSRSRAWRYGTMGITNTPVLPVTSPVANPISGESQRSADEGTSKFE